MIALLFLLASTARADVTIQPCAHARAVYPALAAKSKPGSVLTEEGGVCRIEYTLKAGQTATFEDRQSQIDALEAEIDAIEAKADGDITIADLKRSLKINAILRRIRR